MYAFTLVFSFKVKMLLYFLKVKEIDAFDFLKSRLVWIVYNNKSGERMSHFSTLTFHNLSIVSSYLVAVRAIFMLSIYII
jgi:3-phenylpropionate/cinnamic acid dioxygenase small subunit